LDVAEDADVGDAVEVELETVLEERSAADDVVDERLEAVVETADPDVGVEDDVEDDAPDEESDWAAARPSSPTHVARKCMVV
jgi:hypothetical protein